MKTKKTSLPLPELKSLSFLTTGVALRLGVTKESVVNWCNREALKCTRVHGGHRVITGQNLADFLYYNPRYRALLEEQSATVKGVNSTRDLETMAILTDIYKREPLYTQPEVASMFHCTEETVRNWVRNKSLPVTNKTVYQTPVFSQSDLQYLVDALPRLRIFYTGYNRRRNAS